MLTEQFKANIARGLREYLEAHDMSQNKVAKLCGVNEPYIGYIRKDNWNALPAQGGTALGKISDAVFLKIQQALGLQQLVFETDNYVEVFACMEDAKRRQEWRIIDGLTGAGKSFAARQYALQNPRETFVVDCDNLMNTREFLQTIARAVGASEAGTTHRLCNAIAERLLTMTHPLLIIDETEALMKQRTDSGFKAIKDICKKVEGRVGIVLIGANKFVEALEYRAGNLKSCFPQLLSRFRQDPVVELAVVSREDVALIAPAFGVTGKKEFDRLYDSSANFRELFGALKRRQADEQLMRTAA